MLEKNNLLERLRASANCQSDFDCCQNATTSSSLNQEVTSRGPVGSNSEPSLSAGVGRVKNGTPRDIGIELEVIMTWVPLPLGMTLNPYGCNPNMCWSGQAGLPAPYPVQVGSCLQPPPGKGTFVLLPQDRHQPPQWATWI